MKIGHVVLRQMREKKAKVFLMVLSIAITIGGIGGVLLTTFNLQKEVADYYDTIGANILIVPDKLSRGKAFDGVPFAEQNLRGIDLTLPDKIKTIKNKESISIISPKVVVKATVNNREGVVLGVIFAEELRAKKWWQITGRKPQTGREGLIGENLYEKLGRPAKVKVNGEEFVITGVIKRTGSFEDNSLFLDLKTVLSMFKLNSYTFIEVSALCSTCPIPEIVKQIKALDPAIKVSAMADAIFDRKLLVENFGSFSKQMAYGLLVLGVGNFLILTFSLFKEREKELLIFRTLGFNKLKIFNLYGLEILIVLLVSEVLGSLLMIGLALVLARMLGIVGAQLFSWQYLSFALIGGLILWLAVSLLPVVKVSRLDQQEILREY
ncbi:permease [Carboxydothermus islandicus]|uniref:Permease n=1 Tax=Carboxydothermus islandicus TaxID=661089 RepID=A0A1L8D3W6_9THEO|nr:FtsX-like permease family protein [Carboxydothermus islandicus]GAV25771.1 permease [Carboxydothermus islandicus]